MSAIRSPEWPLKVNCLTGDKSKENCQLCCRNHSEWPLVSEEHLKGWLYGISLKTDRPVVFFEIRRKDCPFHKNNDQSPFCRIENDEFYNRLNPICKLHRVTGKQHKEFLNRCLEQDERIAHYVLASATGVNATNLIELAFEKIEGNIPCYKYRCQYMHLTEIAFPVMLKSRGQLVGVLVSGQILESEGQKEEYLKALHESAAYKQASDEQKTRAENLDNVLLSKEKFQKIIQEFTDAVEHLQEDLDKSMKRLQQETIRTIQAESIDRLTTKASVKLSAEEILISNPLKSEDEALWKRLGDTLGYLMECMDLRSITAYGTNSISDEESARGREKTTRAMKFLRGTKKPNHFRYAWNYSACESYTQKTVLYNEEIKRVISDYTPAGNCMLRLFPTSDGVTAPFAFLIESGSKNPAPDEAEKENSLFDEIALYYMNRWMSLYAHFQSDTLISVTEEIKHEMSQVMAGMDTAIRNIERFLKRIESEIKIYEMSETVIRDWRKFMTYCQDVFRYNISLTLHLSGMEVGRDNYVPVYEKFWPYDKILFKWRYVFEKACKLKDIILETPAVRMNDITRPIMYSDWRLVEQALYNLINNAIKYAHIGSRIHLDCKLSDDRSKYQITVTDYGIPILDADKDRIFGSGERGSIYATDEEGRGIGLYRVSKIAKILQGEVTCASKLLSDHHIPLMSTFCKYRHDSADQALQYQNELDSVPLDRILGESIEYKPMTEVAFTTFLNRPTAEVTFTFSIPHKI